MESKILYRACRQASERGRFGPKLVKRDKVHETRWFGPGHHFDMPHRPPKCADFSLWMVMEQCEITDENGKTKTVPFDKVTLCLVWHTRAHQAATQWPWGTVAPSWPSQPCMARVVQVWFKHPLARRCKRVSFDPSWGALGKPEDGVLNMFNGFNVVPSPTGSCERLLRHHHEVPQPRSVLWRQNLLAGSVWG